MNQTKCCCAKPGTLVAGLLGLSLLLNTGCRPDSPEADSDEDRPESPAADTNNATAIVPAEPTSFAQVTAHLDPGGSLYGFLGVDQWTANLSGRVESWRDVVLSGEDFSDADRANIDKGFDLAGEVIRSSGLEGITGVGVSGIALEKGFYQTKTFLHRAEGAPAVGGWNLLGGPAHDQPEINWLPADTVLAHFSDLNVPGVWHGLKNLAEESGIPEVQESFAQAGEAIAMATGIPADELFASLKGRHGIIVTVDESRRVRLPLPDGSGTFEMGAPGLLVCLAMNNDRVFQQVETMLESNPDLIRDERDGAQLRSMELAVRFPVPVMPTLISMDGYLVIASTDTLAHAFLDTMTGIKPGLGAGDEFKRLTDGLSLEGNSFTFVSEKVGGLVTRFQVMAMESTAEDDPLPRAILERIYGMQANTSSFSLGKHLDDGWLFLTRSGVHPTRIALMPAVAVGGVMAAIAVPNFVKARETAQRNACINNLRQIDGAREQYWLENNTKEVPTLDALSGPDGAIRTYPICPAGGTYDVGSSDETPSCSVPGHELDAW